MKRQDTKLTITIGSKMKSEVSTHAEKHEATVSEVVRAALAMYLAEHGDENENLYTA